MIELTPTKNPGEEKKTPRLRKEEQFINRELSWLKFNERVLRLADDENVPLLERLNFLAIFTSNLDEFYMKRVGGLKRLIAAGITSTSHDGMLPQAQIKAIREAIIPMVDRAQAIFTDEIKPAMDHAGIKLLDWSQLTPIERNQATAYFKKNIFPMLTPLSVDAGHPFPFISNLATSLGVVLTQPDHEEKLFARVKLSGIDPQWIPLGNGHTNKRIYRFISLREVVIHNIKELFPKMNIIACMPFRVTRNADFEIDEADTEDVLEVIEEELRQRRFAKVIRLEHGIDPDPWVMSFLMEELQLEPDEIYELTGELDYGGIRTITSLPIPKAKFRPWTPVIPPALQQEKSFFSIFRDQDVLVHHPYESFSASVERFVREAAEDPKVLSIKMTVYRVGDESPLIPPLIEAAENGKQVVCLVELKARFEEERNIYWAQKLEQAGVHVVYGIPGLKIHAKTVLVVRQEPDGICSYAHIGTGNYHSKTAELYTDFGLFTAKPAYTEELVHLFNYLTGRSLKEDYETLLVSPVNMETRFLEMVDREIEHRKAGRPARIVAKMNSLEDLHMIQALYEASQNGVPVDLIVRGVCCLRPNVPGLSENIRVISVVGRLLEHSRVYYFQNGQDDPVDGECYIGSADWMGRNLHRRVELIIPLLERQHRELCWNSLKILFNDRCLAWDMQPDGSYIRRSPNKGEENTGTHETLMRITRATA